MTDKSNEQDSGMPTPHPSLKELDKFVGKWSMKGHLVGSDEETIGGELVYEWLPGGFFLKQSMKMDFNGLSIESVEHVGYDPETEGLKSFVYSNLSPVPLPYFWKVSGDQVEIKVNYGPLDSIFHGQFTDRGKTFSGGWRPNPGADENVNVPYDVVGHPISKE